MVQKQGGGEGQYESQADVHLAFRKRRLEIQELWEPPNPIAFLPFSTSLIFKKKVYLYNLIKKNVYFELWNRADYKVLFSSTDVAWSLVFGLETIEFFHCSKNPNVSQYCLSLHCNVLTCSITILYAIWNLTFAILQFHICNATILYLQYYNFIFAILQFYICHTILYLHYYNFISATATFSQNAKFAWK